MKTIVISLLTLMLSLSAFAKIPKYHVNECDKNKSHRYCKNVDKYAFQKIYRPGDLPYGIILGVVFVRKGQVLDDDPFDITAGETGWFYIIEDKELQPNPWLIWVKSVGVLSQSDKPTSDEVRNLKECPTEPTPYSVGFLLAASDIRSKGDFSKRHLIRAICMVSHDAELHTDSEITECLDSYHYWMQNKPHTLKCSDKWNNRKK